MLKANSGKEKYSNKSVLHRRTWRLIIAKCYLKKCILAFVLSHPLMSRDIYSGTSGECGERGGEELFLKSFLHMANVTWHIFRNKWRVWWVWWRRTWRTAPRRCFPSSKTRNGTTSNTYNHWDPGTDQTIFLQKSGKILPIPENAFSNWYKLQVLKVLTDHSNWEERLGSFDP